MLLAGPHEVTIMYGGEHVPGSPFKVPISPKSDASKVKVTGPGVEPGGVEPGKPTWFDIDTQDAGKGDARVKVQPVGTSPPFPYRPPPLPPPPPPPRVLLCSSAV